MKKNYLLLLILFLYVQISAQCDPQLKDENGTSGTVTLSCNSWKATGGYILESSGFPNAARSTASYSEAQSVPYAPINGFTGAGTREIELFPDPFTGIRDEDYVTKIDLSADPIFGADPFLFSMFGESFPSFLISSNGFITFDQNIDFDNGETWSTSYFSEQPITSAASSLPQMSIFGVFQDSEFVEGTSRVFLKVIGASPCRKLVIHFEDLRIKETSQLVTSQIILTELSSEIEVYASERTAPTGQPAIIGITNLDGGGVAVPGRNATDWSAGNEGWKFIPSGSVLRREIRWYKDNGITTTRLNTSAYNNRPLVTVFPEKIPAQKFIVEYIYALPGGNFSLKREIAFGFDVSYPLVKNATVAACSSTVPINSSLNQNVSINPEVNFNFYYYNDLADAESGSSAFITGTLDTNKTYYVRVENKSDSSCYAIATLKLASSPQLLTSPPVVEVCELRATNFTFRQLECQLLPSGFYTNARFKINNSSLSGARPFTSGSVVPATLSNGDQLYMWVDTECGTDIMLGPITVILNSGPDISTIFPTILNINLCKIEPINVNLRRFRFDSKQYFVDNGYLTEDPVEEVLLLNSDTVTISVHLTEVAARNGTGALNWISDHSTFPEKVWIRVQEVTDNPCIRGCFSITEVEVNLSFAIVLNVDDDDADTVPDNPAIMDLETADVYLCRSATARTVDMQRDTESDNDSDGRKLIQIMNSVSYTKTYHNSLADATNLASNGVGPTFSLPANATLVNRYVRYRALDASGSPTDCYTVKHLRYHVQTLPAGNNSVFNVCYSSLPVTVNLADYQTEMNRRMFSRSNPDYNLKFFDSAGNSISILTFSGTNIQSSVFVEVPTDPNYGSCTSSRVEFVFKAVENPVMDVEPDGVLEINVTCRNLDPDGNSINVFDLTSLIPGFTTGSYTVRYYKTQNATTGALGGAISAAQATAFPLNSSGTQTVYYQFTAPGTGCSTVARVVFNINISDSAAVNLKKNVILLKCGGPPSVLFNLFDAVPLLYDGMGNPDFSTHVGNSGVSFYQTLDDAINDTSRIVNPESFSVDFGFYKSIFARFQTAGGCFSIIELRLWQVDSDNFVFQNTPFVANRLCDDNLDGIVEFDLRKWLEDNLATHPGFFSDPLVTRSATYTFHLTPDSPPMTPEEEQKFRVDVHNIAFIKASASDCDSDTKAITFSILNSEILSFTHPSFCRENTVDLQSFLSGQSELAGATAFEFYRSDADLISGSNRISNPAAYLYEEGINTLYVKIIGPDSCPRKATIALALKPAPQFEFDNEGIYYFCKNGGDVEINLNTAGNPVRISYYIITLPDGTTVENPNTSFYRANEVGNYQLTVVGENGCTTTKSFEVKAYDTPEIYKIVVEGNKATVLATAANSNRTIQYTYDGLGHWQNDYIFNGVPAGVREFYVRYADNENEDDCTSIPVKTLVLSDTNVITPNADGYNDTWTIKHLDIFEGKPSSLKIFDRYYRVVFEASSNTEIFWDGHYDGRPLETSTYWYVLTIPDGREVTGWILLKNRD